MDDKSPKFKFEKKLGIHEILYGNIPQLIDVIHKLLICMKETNQFHKHDCEFFRLDFRTMNLEEEINRKFPLGSFVLDLKWGFQEEEAPDE
ncbi:MAG: hypothetical protein AABY22_07330 [Nanoarchaeota archaeon]